jgi:large subunit ribosomal protein L9
MKVILFRSVDNLGQAGEVVDVKPGYFRNFLGARGYAKEATRANLALMESRRKKIEAIVAKERTDAQSQKAKIDGTELSFELRANDRGQLFGSVTTADIAAALAAKGHDVDRRKIEISEQIKHLGKFHIRVRLYPEVYGDITVMVERQLRPEDREAMEAEEEQRAARAASKAAKQAEVSEEVSEEATDTPQEEE